MKADYQYREAIQQAVAKIRLLAPVKYKDFHDLKDNNGEILVVDFPLIQWTDTISNEFKKQLALYDTGFIETLKMYVESNHNDIKALPADEHKLLMGVNFHSTEHIKSLLNVLMAIVEEPTTPMAATLPVELSTQKAATLPDELNTEKAKALLMKAAKAGFITIEGDKYIWKGTKALCAYFAYGASNYLKLKVATNGNKERYTSWKPFEQLFGYSGFSLCKNEWRNKAELKPKGYREIEKLFPKKEIDDLFPEEK